MLNTKNYPASVAIQNSTNYFPIQSSKKNVTRKFLLTNFSHDKKRSDTSNLIHLSDYQFGYKVKNKLMYSVTEPVKRKVKKIALQQRVIYNLNQLEYKPTDKIDRFLFEKNSDKVSLLQENFSVGNFKNNHWLNTPGPIYTTQTKANNTGCKILANTNIVGDVNDTLIIFKQPFTQHEVDLVLLDVAMNDGNGFCIDGSKNWNKTNIIEWWADSDIRLNYVIEAYNTELFIPISDSAEDNMPSQQSISENFKLWLDFYRYEMKQYLEWYILKLENIVVVLPELCFDWCLKEKLDKILSTKFLSISRQHTTLF